MHWHLPRLSTAHIHIIIETNLNDVMLLDITSLDFENEFNAHYDLLAPEQTVHAYLDNSDDQVLQKLNPSISLCSSLVRALFDVLRWDVVLSTV